MSPCPASTPGQLRTTVLSLLKTGDLQGAATVMVPVIESAVGSELDSDLEFALCAVFTAYTASSLPSNR